MCDNKSNESLMDSELSSCSTESSSSGPVFSLDEIEDACKDLFGEYLETKDLTDKRKEELMSTISVVFEEIPRGMLLRNEDLAKMLSVLCYESMSNDKSTSESACDAICSLKDSNEEEIISFVEIGLLRNYCRMMKTGARYSLFRTIGAVEKILKISDKVTHMVWRSEIPRTIFFITFDRRSKEEYEEITCLVIEMCVSIDKFVEQDNANKLVEMQSINYVLFTIESYMRCPYLSLKERASEALFCLCEGFKQIFELILSHRIMYPFINNLKSGSEIVLKYTIFTIYEIIDGTYQQRRRIIMMTKILDIYNQYINHETLMVRSAAVTLSNSLLSNDYKTITDFIEKKGLKLLLNRIMIEDELSVEGIYPLYNITTYGNEKHLAEIFPTSNETDVNETNMAEILTISDETDVN